MPDLTLLGDERDVFTLLGRMLFLDADEAAKRYWSAVATRRDEEPSFHFTGPLIEAKPASQIEKDAKAAGLRAGDAGFVVHFLCAAYVRGQSGVSIQNAIDSRLQLLEGAAKEVGERFNYHPDAIARNWREFRPVAHLWAAAEYIRPPSNDRAFPGIDAIAFDLPLFLVVAESYRKFGEDEWRAPRRKKPEPLLHHETTWKVPKDSPWPRPPFEFKADT